MADSDFEDLIDQYYEDLVYNSIDADDTGSNNSVCSDDTADLTDFEFDSNRDRESDTNIDRQLSFGQE